MNMTFSSILIIILLNSYAFFSVKSMETLKSPLDELYLAENEKKLGDAQKEGVKVLEDFPIISHLWVGNFFSQLHDFTFLVSIDDKSVSEVLSLLEKSIFQTCPPFGDYHEVETFDAKIGYNNFIQMTNIHLLRNKHDFLGILIKIDHLLANIRIQELIFGTQKKPNKSRQASFDSIKRNLLLLRHDVELAIILKQKSFEKEKQVIQSDSGRVFCVEKSHLKREIRPVGSGTIVDIQKRNFILTCRHLLEFEYSPESELEIYFIPDDMLSKQDFLPKERLPDTNIDWNKYQNCMVKSLLLINSKEASHKDKVDQTPLTDHIVLHAGDIRRIEELENNNDIMLMDAEILTAIPISKNKLIHYDEKKINMKHALVAGYPAAGFADYSFIVAGTSSSQKYQKALSYAKPPLLSDYTFSDFPVVHGMSGGSVFTITTEPLVFGVLCGADLVKLSTRCSIITEELLKRLNIYIAKLVKS